MITNYFWYEDKQYALSSVRTGKETYDLRVLPVEDGKIVYKAVWQDLTYSLRHLLFSLIRKNGKRLSSGN